MVDQIFHSNSSEKISIEYNLLDAVITTGNSAKVDSSSLTAITFHIISSGVTTGAVVEIQSSLNGVNWATANESTKTISANGVTEFNVSGARYKYIRANITSRTDGTYTVLAFGGN